MAHHTQATKTLHCLIAHALLSSACLHPPATDDLCQPTVFVLLPQVYTTSPLHTAHTEHNHHSITCWPLRTQLGPTASQRPHRRCRSISPRVEESPPRHKGSPRLAMLQLHDALACAWPHTHTLGNAHIPHKGLARKKNPHAPSHRETELMALHQPACCSPHYSAQLLKTEHMMTEHGGCSLSHAIFHRRWAPHSHAAAS